MSDESLAALHLATLQAPLTGDQAVGMVATTQNEFGWQKWVFASSGASGSSTARQEAYETISTIVRESCTSAKGMATMIAEDTTKDRVSVIREDV